MNYVLIYPDELRAESLGCYGHPVVQTPHIDALAREGTLFEQNYSANPVCVASRCSLVTGWYPHVNGYRSQKNLISDTQYNFFRYLKEADYTIAIAGKDDCFDSASTDRLFHEHLTRKNRFGFGEAGKKNYTMIEPPVSLEGSPDQRTTEDSVDFIRRHSKDEKPFFLWINYLCPHPAYTCPEPWYSMYKDKSLPRREDEWLKGKPKLYGLTRFYREADEEEPEVFHKMNAIYLGMISYIDMLTGKIIEALKNEGIYEDTTIIFCSDHGDFAGDARLCEKHPNALDDMLVRVPLIIRRPGAAQNHRVRELCQSIDIFPTVFAFEKIKIRHDQFGVSLKEQVNGNCGDQERVVYAEGGYDIREPQCFENIGISEAAKKVMGPGTVYYPKFRQQEESPESVCRSVMRRDAHTKIIVRTNGENEMYDMVKDPEEYHNLFLREEYKEKFYQLAYRCLEWLIATSDVVPQLEETFGTWYEETCGSINFE